MLVISGLRLIQSLTRLTISSSFNLAIEMLVISGSGCVVARETGALGFNLAIEMLVISGCYPCLTGLCVLFQSRNRDACHFRFWGNGARLRALSFQSRNRDACHFRSQPAEPLIRFG